MLERLEIKIRQQLDGNKIKRLIYIKEVYDAPISKSNLSHFNPKELIEIDLITPFSNRLLQLKTTVNGTNNTEIGIRDLVGIEDYNLEPATNSIDGELDLEGVKHIAIDGSERAYSKINSLFKNLVGISKTIGVPLKKVLDQLYLELLKHTNNESVSTLRLKLAKSNCQVVAKICLPIETYTKVARSIAIEAAHVSRCVYPNKPVTFFFQ